MVEKAQNEFDFQSFVYSLEDLAPDEILRRVEREIKKTSNPPFQDLIKKFIKDLEKKIREMGYERKMRRLRSFLETGGLPVPTKNSIGVKVGFPAFWRDFLFSKNGVVVKV